VPPPGTEGAAAGDSGGFRDVDPVFSGMVAHEKSRAARMMAAAALTRAGFKKAGIRIQFIISIYRYYKQILEKFNFGKFLTPFSKYHAIFKTL
jgi:hypothetical protein